MRLRNVKGAREKIENSPFTINEDDKSKLYSKKGSWNKTFNNDNPIYIEIGMGKGQFIINLAKQNHHINYIGIEKFSSVLVRAIEYRQNLEQTENLNLKNLLFIRMDAENLDYVFEHNEISQIYLNFSDPWPKERHAKRRLTSRQFLKKYNNILSPKGKICFKTDNRALFDFSLIEV